MFNPRIYENSRPDGIPVLEVAGEGAEQPAQLSFVPLQRTQLQGVVSGPLADLYLTQVFGYDRTTYPDAIEALYRFPLPGDAAVQGVIVRFGEVEIVATLQERAAAEATYGEAKAAGHQAALASREAPDLFTLQITGIQPNQLVTIETHYVQLARADQSGFSVTGERIPQWSLRIPLTTAPRYVRADEQAGRWAQAQPLALLRDPRHRFALDLTFHGVSEVTSPTHQLAVTPNLSPHPSTPNAASVHIQLADGEVLPDRDCLLRWSPPQLAADPTIQWITYWDGVAGQAQPGEREDAMLYFLAVVTPPSQRVTEENRREALLLVDHSGSMRGAKWSAADWAVERFLGDLGQQDAFALATFHNKTRWFAEAVQPGQAQMTASAIKWLHAQTDSGGTELGVALEQALQLPRPQPAPATTLTRHLLIVTDAAVSDSARILRLADTEATKPDRRRISVLCIDAAPNAFLAHELAERGGGVARFLTSDPAQDDIVTALDDLLLEWSEPLLVNMQLTFNRPGVTVSGHPPLVNDAERLDHETVIDLGDLPAGRTQWIVGRLPMSAVTGSAGNRSEPLMLALSVEHAGERRTIAKSRVAMSEILPPETAHAAPEETNGNEALKALFGARRVNALEFFMHAQLDEAQLTDQLRRLGYDPRELFPGQPAGHETVYAENRQKQQAAALHDLLVREALAYGLASAETAFVATRKEAGKPVTATVQVANALPAGWSSDFVTAGMPSIHLRRARLESPPAAPAAYRSTPTSGRGLGSQMRQMLTPSFMAPPTAETSFAASQAPAPDPSPAGAGQSYTLFAGIPTFDGHSALLFASNDTAAEGSQPGVQLPAPMTIRAITLEVTAEHATFQPDRSVTIAIYIEDLIMPRATVRLIDLLRHGTRPLNLQRTAAAPLRITLDDPTGRMRTAAIAFSLRITAS